MSERHSRLARQIHEGTRPDRDICYPVRACVLAIRAEEERTTDGAMACGKSRQVNSH